MKLALYLPNFRDQVTVDELAELIGVWSARCLAAQDRNFVANPQGQIRRNPDSALIHGDAPSDRELATLVSDPPSVRKMPGIAIRVTDR